MIDRVKCILKIQEYHPYIMAFVLFLFYIIGEMHQTGIGRVGGSKTGLIFIRAYGLGYIRPIDHRLLI